jgi:hypothetical protein
MQPALSVPDTVRYLQTYAVSSSNSNITGFIVALSLGELWRKGRVCRIRVFQRRPILLFVKYTEKNCKPYFLSKKCMPQSNESYSLSHSIDGYVVARVCMGATDALFGALLRKPHLR